MKILIKNISESKMKYSGEVVREKLFNNGDEINIEDNIKFDGTLKKGRDFVEIEGNVEVEFETSCHLCGGLVKDKVEFYMSETYRVEPSEDEYELVSNEVDFDDAIISNLRLNLPVKFLCKEDCKGLCPKCNKNLNFENCECERL